MRVEEGGGRDRAVIKPIKKRTLSEEVMEQLSQLIFEGHFAPGARLPAERELAERFQVARGPVREALRGLAMIGMVEIRPTAGIFVAQPGSFARQHVLWVYQRERNRIREVYEARRLIETELVVLATVHGSRAHKEKIRRLWERMHRMGAGNVDLEEFVAAHTEFNHAIAEASGNQVLGRLLEVLRVLQENAHRQILALPRALENSIQRDGALVQAILSGDPEAARRAAKEHFDSALRLLEKPAGTAPRKTRRPSV